MDAFFNSDPWSDFYGLAHSPFPANSRNRPPIPSVASKSRFQRRPVAASLTPAPARKPRVVSIPVNDSVADGWNGRRAAATTGLLAASDAATRIQKVFRGFQVRRMVEKVSGIASEVEAIEEMLASMTAVEKIRSDPREKLRVGELLMRLLLRLDSVHGVRDYRRKVIRRAIRMQEMVDTVPSAEQTIDAQPAEGNAHEEEAVDDGFLVFSMDEEPSSSTEVPESETVSERSTMENDSLVPSPTATDIVAEVCVEPTERETEMVTKILPENEKLQQLVAALREQSAQQCKLIEGLTSRVTNLEHALQEMERRER